MEFFNHISIHCPEKLRDLIQIDAINTKRVDSPFNFNNQSPLQYLINNINNFGFSRMLVYYAV